MASRLPQYQYQDGRWWVLRPESEWGVVPKTAYEVDKKTGKVVQRLTGETEYDPSTVYRPADYQESTALNTQETRSQSSSFNRQPMEPYFKTARQSGKASSKNKKGRSGGGVTYPVQVEAGSYWPAPGEPGAPTYLNRPGTSGGGGWFDAAGNRLMNYNPDVARRMSEARSGGSGVARTGLSAPSDSGGDMGLTPEESARLEEAIMRLESGRGSEWVGRMGELALESAEHPGMTDAEREATFKRLNREEILPGYEAERTAVATIGGPGARQRLGALRLGEAGARMNLASSLGEEQLRSQRQERQSALNTLGSAADIERAYTGDVVSDLLRYGSTPGHGTAGRALPTVSDEEMGGLRSGPMATLRSQRGKRVGKTRGFTGGQDRYAFAPFRRTLG